MAKLYNKKTGREVEVAPDQMKAMVDSKAFTTEKPEAKATPVAKKEA